MESAILENESVPGIQIQDRSGKYLVFALGREEFGIRVMQVREIMGLQDITAAPRTPAHVRGVINLRGKVISVVDLRLRFGLPPQEYTQRTCIIVVQVKGVSGRPVEMGVVVDSVVEVLSLTCSDIEDTPSCHEGTVPYGSLGMARVKDKVKILLEIEEVLTGRDTGL